MVQLQQDISATMGITGASFYILGLMAGLVCLENVRKKYGKGLKVGNQWENVKHLKFVPCLMKEKKP